MSDSKVFRVGDRVRITDDYGGELGTVGYVFESTPKVSVNWDDGATDNWNIEDLEKVEGE